MGVKGVTPLGAPVNTSLGRKNQDKKWEMKWKSCSSLDGSVCSIGISESGTRGEKKMLG